MGVIARASCIAAFAAAAFFVNAQTNYTVLRSFGIVDQAGADPDVLIEGADGVLYGSAGIGARTDATASADNPARGLVFKLQKHGSGYVILHRFTQSNQYPTELVYATNGVLYGTTALGGAFNRGTVFRLNTDGSGFAVLHDFAGGSADGEGPRGLMQGSDGVLYGTTIAGGTSGCPPLCAPDCMGIAPPGGCGTAFRINLDGSQFTIIRHFSGIGNDGKHPMAGLAEGNDGMLYGTTSRGGAANRGTVFRISKDGSLYTSIVHFDGTNGALPAAALIQGSDDMLYGTTQNGGTADAGTFFKVNTDGTSHEVLHRFAGAPDGRAPSTRLVEGTDGAIYGSTGYAISGSSLHPGTMFKANKDGTGYQVLRTYVSVQRLVLGSDGLIYGTQRRPPSPWSSWTRPTEVFRMSNDGTYEPLRPFTSGGGDGFGPLVLIEGSDRFLYGVTLGGGKDYLGQGIVFKLAKDGSGYTVLRYISHEPEGDSYPRSLIEGTDGALYGGLKFGGTLDGGIIFKMNKDGSGYTVVVNFDYTNGAWPSEGLIEGSDGALYGTTERGGSRDRGVVYKANKDGSGYTVLHSFAGAEFGDTAFNFFGVLEGSDGWLYGGSYRAGGLSRGMIFKLRKDGSDYHELYNFFDPGWGTYSGSCGGLIEARNGDIYGTTMDGGTMETGTLFKIAKSGSNYTQLVSFSPGFAEFKRVMQASDGVLYGVMYGVGASQGALYRVNPDGSGYAILHEFVNVGGDGNAPWGGLIEGSDGALYGTTMAGGALELGTVFRYVPQPEIIALRREIDGHVRVTARALSGATLAIEASTDLSTWTEIDSGPVIDGQFNADDLSATNHQHRFYRARLR